MSIALFWPVFTQNICIIMTWGLLEPNQHTSNTKHAIRNFGLQTTLKDAYLLSIWPQDPQYKPTDKMSYCLIFWGGGNVENKRLSLHYVKTILAVIGFIKSVDRTYDKYTVDSF